MISSEVSYDGFRLHAWVRLLELACRFIKFRLRSGSETNIEAFTCQLLAELRSNAIGPPSNKGPNTLASIPRQVVQFPPDEVSIDTLD